MAWIAPRSAPLSAAVAAPLPPRAATTLSSCLATNRGGRIMSRPWIFAVKAPVARAESAARAAAAESTAAGPWVAGL